MIIFWFVFGQYLVSGTVLKILSRDWKFTSKEVCLVILSAFIVGFLFEFINIFAAGLIFTFLLLDSLKIKGYNLKKALFLSSISMLIAVLCDHFTTFLLGNMFLIDYSYEKVLLTMHMPILAISAISLAFALAVFTKKVRLEINKYEHLQTGLMILSLFMVGSFYGSIILGIYWGNTIELIVLNFFFFALYALLAFVSLFFLAKGAKEKYNLKRQKDEQEALRQYNAQIELQYSEMRTFKYDYKNIMSSFVGFLIKDDMNGLKKYYLEKVDGDFRTFLDHDFALEQLRHIKITEVKSILAVKLMLAQKQEIEVKFEAVETIEEISVDSLILVRTLGILLDNAIEELTNLKKGFLHVGVIKIGSSLTFVIQNTCRLDTPPVHILKQKGFSTKGDNRGVGLNNILEFIKQCPNMSIETNISDQIFRQEIIIRGD